MGESLGLRPTVHDDDTSKVSFSGRVFSLRETPSKQERSEMATDAVRVCRSQ
jgi:hypothetical protein